jgi:hypothetical protein
VVAGYREDGAVRGEQRLNKRSQAPAVEHEALVAYHAARIRTVSVYIENGEIWQALVGELLRGDVVGTKRTLRRDAWTTTRSRAQSLFS